EHPCEPEIDLAAALALLDPADVILVEGYKGAEIEKIEVWRPAHGQSPLWPADDRIVAVATDAAAADLPAPLGARRLLPLNAPEAVAGYVLERLGHDAPDMDRQAPAEARR
ncbi:MAG: molybdopterin-guanine dinucleotide biosynthesis protein MobB, partial [Alphaproteobacteria bacterium]